MGQSSFRGVPDRRSSTHRVPTHERSSLWRVSRAGHTPIAAVGPHQWILVERWHLLALAAWCIQLLTGGVGGVEVRVGAEGAAAVMLV